MRAVRRYTKYSFLYEYFSCCMEPTRSIAVTENRIEFPVLCVSREKQPTEVITISVGCERWEYFHFYHTVQCITVLAPFQPEPCAFSCQSETNPVGPVGYLRPMIFANVSYPPNQPSGQSYLIFSTRRSFNRRWDDATM